MVVRLILDRLARGPRSAFLLLPLLVIGWQMVAISRIPRETLLAVSMAAAYCVGTFLTHRLVTREVAVMPIAARQLWLARWWLGTAGAVLCTAVPKLLVPMHDLSFALLSMLCDFAYTGVCLALWPVFDIKPRGPLWWRALVVRSGMILWLLTIGGGAIGWSFVLRPVLPAEWGDLRAPAGLVMLVALALTLRGYLYAPPPGAPREVSRSRAGSANPSPSRSMTTRMPAANRTRVTGVAYLLWRDAVVSLVYAAVVVGGIVLLSWFERPAGISATLDRTAYVLVPRPSEFFGRSAWLVLLFACCPAGLFWHGILRHIRTLPISTTRIIGLLVAIPLFRWLAVWSIVALLFTLDGRVPARPELDTLAAFTGIVALMHAIGLRWNNITRPWAILAVVVVSLVAVSPPVNLVEAILAVAAGLGLSAPAFVGLVSIAAACLLHYDTLTRRSKTYRLPHIGYDAFTPGMP